MTKNYATTHIDGITSDLGGQERVTFRDALALTGSEISVNAMEPGGFRPYVHSHKLNEEIYIVLSGSGEFMVDGEEFPIQTGSVIRVDPAGERAIKASDDQALTYMCIQVEAGSLTQATREDGILNESKASWMK